MKVAVIMGSKSDWPVLEKTVAELKKFGVEVEARVMSAHRSPELAAGFADEAEQNGFEVIIAAAGKAAHLAGVIEKKKEMLDGVLKADEQLQDEIKNI